MGRELSPSRQRGLLKKKKGEQLVTRAAFHLALSKPAYSVCTHTPRVVVVVVVGAVPFKREGKKGEKTG